MRGKTIAVLAVLLVIGVLGGFGLGSWYLKQDHGGRSRPDQPSVPTQGVTPAGAETTRIVRIAPRGDGAELPRIEVELDAVPRDPKAVEAGFSMVPRLAGTFTWQDKTLVFQPSSPLQPGHLYTVRLESAGVLPGVDGRLIDGKGTEWAFTVAGGPAGDITGIEYYGAGYQFAQVGADGSRTALATVPTDKSLDDPVWSPAGDRLLFQSGFLFALSPDNPQTAQPVASFEQGAVDAYHATWAPDGRSVVLQHGGVVYTQSLAAGVGPKPLPGTFSGLVYPVWSPAGGRLAVFAKGGSTGELWLMTGTGSSRKSIATGVSGFAWAPDGKTLAYVKGLKVDSELHIYDVAAARDSQVGKAPGGELLWSPDGARLAIHYGNEIWTVGADGRDLGPVAHSVRDTAGSIAWSPTGAYLAYVDQVGHLWRIRADGEGAKQLTTGQEQWLLPRWAGR
ncbi:MAG: eIF2A-related protein [Symbiobacteriia bacterium]